MVTMLYGSQLRENNELGSHMDKPVKERPAKIYGSIATKKD
jgi:hypothetical protein